MQNILGENMDSEMKFDKETWIIDKKCFQFHGGITHGKIEDMETTTKIRELTKEFNKNDVFLDIGANFGTMSLASKCKTYAFEPCISTFGILKSNIKLNKRTDIIPICEAVYDIETNYTVIEHKDKYIGMNSIDVSKGDRTTITIDKWVKENNIKNVKLIKVDTEGCDSKVIEGAQELIKRDKPIIITETFGKDTLELIGYKLLEDVNINKILVPNEKDK